MPNENANEPFDLREYLRPIRSRLWLIVLLVVVATAGTYAFNARKPKVYQTSTQLYFTASELDPVLGVGGSAGAGVGSVDNAAQLLPTRAVATEAARRLRFRGDPRLLLGYVTAASDGEKSSFMMISATSGNPRDAARIANAFAAAFVYTQTEERQKEARTARVAAEQELNRNFGGRLERSALYDRIQRLRVLEALPAGQGNIRRLDPAVVPTAAISPNPGRNAVFAFVLSLALGIAAAFGLERFDRRIRRHDDLERIIGQPVLGELPEVSTPAPLIGGEPSLSPEFREAFRSLRMNLDLARLSGELRTIVVTSALPGEGKSTVTRNLAIVFREAGLRVGVVDTDLRAPRMDRMLITEREPGLTHVLTGGATLDEALQEAPVNVEGLETLAKVRAGKIASTASELPPWNVPTNGNGAHNGSGEGDAHGVGALMVLASGASPGSAANPASVLAADQMAAVLKACAERFDVVLIDTAPMVPVSDAVPLLSAADGVLVVARLGEATFDSTTRLASQLDRVPSARVLGVVANGIPQGDRRGRSYSHYYHYSPRGGD